jgi:hypothetical protein
MTDKKTVSNQTTYHVEVVDGEINLKSVDYPSEFVGEDGKVVLTCEQIPLTAHNLVIGQEIPFATSPSDEEPNPPEIARDQMVMHQTVGGRGVVGRLRKS